MVYCYFNLESFKAGVILRESEGSTFSVAIMDPAVNPRLRGEQDDRKRQGLRVRGLRYARILLLCVFIFLVCFGQGHAKDGLSRESQDQLASDGVPPAFRTTNLPIPRYVSLGSQKIFVRAGPGVRYPIKWVYERSGFPVEIILEYEVWRKIRDFEGEEGWVHQSLISGQRTGLLLGKAEADIRSRPDSAARVMAKLQPMAQFAIEKCQPGWCKVSAQGYSGWLARKNIWGIYEGENFD